MKQKTIKMAINHDALDAELTAILERQKQDRCPKCKNLLTESEQVNGTTIHHCWGCGLAGTFKEMSEQSERFSRRAIETDSKVDCGLCGIKGTIWHDLRPKTIYGDKYPMGRSLFICFDCMPDK